jgi:hypothetical protein
MMLVADLKLAPRTSYLCDAPAIGRMSGGISITSGRSVRFFRQGPTCRGRPIRLLGADEFEVLS